LPISLRTRVQVVVGGPSVSGSSSGGVGGKVCRLRGRIPGSETEACQKEEKHIKDRYAKRMGIAGLTLNQSQGPEKPKKRPIGSSVKMAVIMLMGRSLEF